MKEGSSVTGPIFFPNHIHVSPLHFSSLIFHSFTNYWTSRNTTRKYLKSRSCSSNYLKRVKSNYTAANIPYHFEGFQRALYQSKSREKSSRLSGSNAENVVNLKSVWQLVPRWIVNVICDPLQSECDDRRIVTMRQNCTNADHNCHSCYKIVGIETIWRLQKSILIIISDSISFQFVFCPTIRTTKSAVETKIELETIWMKMVSLSKPEKRPKNLLGVEIFTSQFQYWSKNCGTYLWIFTWNWWFCMICGSMWSSIDRLFDEIASYFPSIEQWSAQNASM